MRAQPLDLQSVIRVGLAVVLVGVLALVLPEQRTGDDRGRRPAHPPIARDLFERAGVTELAEGQRGPAFRLAFMDGRVASLEEWHDRLVVLNFWATWCRPCTTEMPALEALWNRYRERGLVVVGISVDRGASRDVLEPYLRTLGLTFPILLDPELATAGAWRVTALPSTFIVRPGGEVAGIAVGAREWNGAEMTALIETLLPAVR